MNSLFPLSCFEPRELRPYQARAVELLRGSLRAGHKRPVLQLPTGSGKTRIAAEIILGALAKEKRAIFVVPRISLIEQTVAAFEREGVNAIGVIQGQNFRTDGAAPVQVASAQTLVRRPLADRNASLVIIDEAHLSFKKITDWMASEDWSKIPFIGLTATPWAKGMGKVYDDLIKPTSIAEMIAEGYLSPFRVFAPPPPDLSKVRTANTGDYREDDLSDACDTKEIVADVIKTWFAKGEGRSTLCYGVDRKHAMHLQDRFLESGVATEYIDCDTPMFDREDIFRRFQSNDTKLICNVATLDTGIDLDVRCIIDARPTKSRIRFVQTIGRGLRPGEGKDYLLILDHGGNHLRLGRVTDIDFPDLDDGSQRTNRDKGKSERDTVIKLCPECRCILPPRARECPACGFKIFASTDITEKAGELVEFGLTAPRPKTKKPDVSKLDKQEFWSGFLYLAEQHGRKQGWAAYRFKERFGIWPRGLMDNPSPPSVAVRNFDASRRIAWAAGRARRGP